MSNGLIDVVMDSQPRQTAMALVELLVRLQSDEGFDPLRHRVHIPLQIVTPENLCN